MMRPNRVEVAGVPVDCVDMRSAVEFIEYTILNSEQISILAVNPEKIMAARNDPATMRSLRKAGLLVPDGIGAVWAARLLAGQAISRVAGSDLMPEICDMCANRGIGIFLYGAKPGIADRAAEELMRRYPLLKIAGTQHGFLHQADMPKLIAKINESGAEVLFVALGSPRQELWIEQYSNELSVKVYQGVGGTFNVLAGEVHRAPVIFRKLNLEWFYRLITEPTRIVRQMNLPVFAVLVIWEKLRIFLLGKRL